MLMVSQTNLRDFGNAVPHPLDAHLSADPLVDSVLYRCFGRDTTKLANDGEQFHVADLRREWWRLCQSHLPFDCGGQSRFRRLVCRADYGCGILSGFLRTLAV